MKLQQPTKLQKGDKVAAITLSWGGAAAFLERYQLGKTRFEELLGLQLIETKHALYDPEWIAQNPKARADDLMEAFSDSSIKAIVNIIGGDDSVRLAPYVDYAVIRKNPKIFMGYSDTTSVHFMCLKAGLSSFYGPSILDEFAENVACHDYTINAVKRAFFEDWTKEVILSSETWTAEMLSWDDERNAQIARKMFPALGPRVLQGQGVVRGPLIGGCLEVLEMLRGTELWPSQDMWDGAILFIETSEERPSLTYFRRWIRGYMSMGVLPRIKGILLGRPCCDFDEEELVSYDNVLLEVVRDECGFDDLPIMTQLDFGHSSPKFVLPYGREITIDCEKKVLFS